MPYIPTLYEIPPPQETTNVGRPVFGRTVASLGNAQKNMLGFRGLRYMSQVVDYNTVAQDRPPAPGPGPGIVYSPRMRFVVSPIARWLWVGFYASLQEQRTTGVNVTLHIEDPSGVIIDGPFTWSGANGRGVGADYRHGNANIDGRDILYHTGWRKEDTGVIPRLVDLSGYNGKDVVLYLTLTGARVHAFFALEAYEPQVEMIPAPRLVISELDYDNVDADLTEFVEIYNAGNADQDLTNVKLDHYDAWGTFIISYSLNVGDGILKPGDRLVVGMAAIIAGLPPGTKNVTQTNTMNNIAAAVAVMDGTVRLDSVTWEQPWGGIPPWTEGTELPADAGTANSFQRFPTDGHDSQDNASDFHLAAPSPGLPNN